MPISTHKRILSLTTALALAPGLVLSSQPARADGPDLALYAELLERYTRSVSDLAGTRVDYRGLRTERKWRLLVAHLEAAHPAQLERRDERLAFWINAYNILAIQTVLDAYPVDSIRDIGSIFSSVWKLQAGSIEGEPVTLDQIEHQILRPMGDPRIHAAIVCASTSCPSLRRKPFTVARIDVELGETMRRFLADRGKGMRIDRSSKKITFSRIFEWFEDDFETRGGVVEAITAYAPDDDRAWLEEHGDSASFDYFEYDWRLNDTTPPAQR